MGVVLCDAMCTVQTIGGGRLSAADPSDDRKASVLHVVGLTAPPEAYFPESDAIAVRLSPHGFEQLVTFIHETYKRDEHGRPLPVGPGWYAYSKFYLATGTYHLLNTCNTWVAKALRAAGLPMSPASAMTAGSVIAQVSKFGTTLRAK